MLKHPGRGGCGEEEVLSPGEGAERLYLVPAPVRGEALQLEGVARVSLLLTP